METLYQVRLNDRGSTVISEGFDPVDSRCFVASEQQVVGTYLRDLVNTYASYSEGISPIPVIMLKQMSNETGVPIVKIRDMILDDPAMLMVQIGDRGYFPWFVDRNGIPYDTAIDFESKNGQQINLDVVYQSPIKDKLGYTKSTDEGEWKRARKAFVTKIQKDSINPKQLYKAAFRPVYRRNSTVIETYRQCGARAMQDMVGKLGVDSLRMTFVPYDSSKRNSYVEKCLRLRIIDLEARMCKKAKKVRAEIISKESLGALIADDWMGDRSVTCDSLYMSDMVRRLLGDKAVRARLSQFVTLNDTAVSDKGLYLSMARFVDVMCNGDDQVTEALLYSQCGARSVLEMLLLSKAIGVFDPDTRELQVFLKRFVETEGKGQGVLPMCPGQGFGPVGQILPQSGVICAPVGNAGKKTEDFISRFGRFNDRYREEGKFVRKFGVQAQLLLSDWQIPFIYTLWQKLVDDYTDILTSLGCNLEDVEGALKYYEEIYALSRSDVLDRVIEITDQYYLDVKSKTQDGQQQVESFWNALFGGTMDSNRVSNITEDYLQKLSNTPNGGIDILRRRMACFTNNDCEKFCEYTGIGPTTKNRSSLRVTMALIYRVILGIQYELERDILSRPGVIGIITDGDSDKVLYDLSFRTVPASSGKLPVAVVPVPDMNRLKTLGLI